MANYRTVKGVQDILPPDVHVWQSIEQVATEVFASYGYLEARLPIMESTEVFSRGIGQGTDIIEKEMYTFDDKGGRSISLRPEGTASMVRAYVQHGLHTKPSPLKLFYTGPMFRYERPQKGRLRQFYQIGAEAFGIASPVMDAEIISMLMVFLGRVGLGGLECQINSLGCKECRPAYRDALKEFFAPKLKDMCADCQRRYDENPLRLIDCKVPACKEERQGAPSVLEHLCRNCSSHFEKLKARLDKLDIKYIINHEMVRGLDYYTGTAFEVTSDELGAQSAVAAGGRYDGLVKSFGGPDTPAIGFALGMERLVELVKDNASIAPTPDIFIATIGTEASNEALLIAKRLRSKGLWVEINYGSGGLKGQMKRADKMGCGYVLIIGDDELARGEVNYKDFKNRTDGQIPINELEEFFTQK